MRAIDAFLRDVKQGARLLTRHRGFAAAALITIALGVGGTSAVFSVVYGVLLRPLPYPEPDRLVRLSEVHPGANAPFTGALLSTPTYHAWSRALRDTKASRERGADVRGAEASVRREREGDARAGRERMAGAATNASLEAIGAFRVSDFTLTGAAGERGADAAQRVRGTRVTPSLLRLLHVSPFAGRFFSDADGEPGAEAVVVISHAMWRERFGGSQSATGAIAARDASGAIGALIALDGVPHRVVGIAPPGFAFPGRTQGWSDSPQDVALYTPLAIPAVNPAATVIGIVNAIARLAPGATIAQAEAEGTAYARHADRPFAELVFGKGGPVDVRVRSIADQMTMTVQPALMVLTAAIGLVLLIACANVANLLLSRGADRTREIGVRAALGASRRRLVAQLVTESLVVSLIGGLAGVFVGWTLTTAVPALAPANFPRVDDVRVDAWFLATAVLTAIVVGSLSGLVLLVACSNVANLLLSRALARDREIALRLALGAGRGRIVRQLLTESVLLALLGAGVAVACALLGIRLLRDVVAMPLPPWMRIEVNGPVLAVLLLTALAIGLAAGLVPAFRVGRDVRATLSDGGRGSSAGAGHAAVRSVLVVAEVALACLLLVGASLLARSVGRLQSVDPGFDTRGLLTYRVELGWRAYDTLDKAVHFQSTVLERLSALPGVEAVAFDSNVALSGKARETDTIIVEGQSTAERDRNPFVNWHTVNAGFFSAMRVPIVAGRSFSELDIAPTTLVSIVSERLAQRLWPGQDPLGKRLMWTGSPEQKWLTVVGVAGNVQHQQIGGETGLDMYQPLRQLQMNGGWFAIRTRVDPTTLTRPATALVAAVDPNQSFFDVQTMTERIEGSIWQRRAAGSLFVAFAAIAILLAAVGLYGVLSYIVSQQWRELGVRVALGARPRDIYGLVVGRGLWLTGVGLAVGIALGVVVASSVSALVFGISPFDPLTFVGVPMLVACVAVVACVIPARRATTVDPIVALRGD